MSDDNQESGARAARQIEVDTASPERKGKKKQMQNKQVTVSA